jgi:hypothetical protein
MGTADRQTRSKTSQKPGGGGPNVTFKAYFGGDLTWSALLPAADDVDGPQESPVDTTDGGNGGRGQDTTR